MRSQRLFIYLTAISCAVVAACQSIGATVSPSNSTWEKSPDGYRVTTATTHADFQTVVLDGVSFDRLSTTGDAILGESGGPAVPAWSKWISIPAGMRPVLRWSVSGEKTYSAINLSPSPVAASDNPEQPVIPLYSEERYSADEWLPAEPATVTEPLTVAGGRWAVLTHTPYRYNPALRELRVAEQLQVEVTFAPDPNAPATPPQDSELPVWRELRRALDPEQPSRDDYTNRMDNLGHLVIIVPDDDDAVDALQPLVEWKRRKGYMVTLATMAVIGNDKLDLTIWLQNAYDTWPVKPTFVMLVGDATGETLTIPYYKDDRAAWVGWHVSDNFFVNWVGDSADADAIDNWIPEGLIGRLSASNVGEVDKLVNKILGYEMTPYTEEPWVEGAVLLADGVHSCIETSNAVAELMTGVGYRDNHIYKFHREYWGGGAYLNIGDIKDAVNSGVGFVNFRGYDTWGNITPADIAALDNDWKLPVLTGMVCGTNDFTGAYVGGGIAIGEAWVEYWENANDPQGAVACYGPTDDYTWTWFNNTMSAAFYHLLLNRDVRTLGALCLGAKLSLLSAFPSDLRFENGQTVGYYFYTYTLLGDPTLQVWTHDPQPMTAEFADELPVGANNLEVTVTDNDGAPVTGAYVHVFLDTLTRFGGFTDNQGRLALITDPLSEGEYLLTVTAPDMVPILESFQVSPATSYAALTDVSLDDDGEGGSEGNNDGNLNPGETVELTLTIANRGEDALEAFTASLETESDLVELVDAEADYGALNPGDAEENGSPFVFRLLPEAPDGARIGFTLSIPNEVGEWTSVFELPVKGYRFAVSAWSFTDGNLEPGTERELVVTIENRGELDARQLTALLGCDDSKIQLRRPESLFDQIAIGEQTDNHLYPFLVYASRDAYLGKEVTFTLNLTDDAGCSAAADFQTTLGEPSVAGPQGPDSYGYYVFDAADTAGGMASDYEWIQCETRVEGLNDPNDFGDPLGTGGAVTRIDLPFEFTYYGQDYDSITVGSNGWLSFNATGLVAANNYPIGSPLAPPAMLCPFWEDLWNGDVYESYDEDNARFIVEWRDWSYEGGSIDFEVILYNPTVVATLTGDGEIVFQYYNTPRMRDFADEDFTVGIVSPDRQDGIQVAYAGDWDPRTIELADEMALRISTGAFTERGSVAGRVTKVSDDSPISGARVMIDGTGFFDNTDAEGIYQIDNIPIGAYSLTAYKRHWNYDYAADIQINIGETASADFALTKPEFNTDIEAIEYGLRPDSVGEVGFSVWNTGNGPLEYKLNIIFYLDDVHRDRPWDELFSFDATEASGVWMEDFFSGIAYDGESFFIPGPFELRRLPHKMYVFNHDGEMTSVFDQYTTDSSRSAIVRGYGEIDFNGENLLAVDGSHIVEITRDGQLVQSFDAPVNNIQSLAWSPERGSIFASPIIGGRIYEMDTYGQVLTTDTTGELDLQIFAMAWYPEEREGYNLYLFCEEATPDTATKLALYRLNPETDDIKYVRHLYLNRYDRPVGCDITKFWDPLFWTLAVLVTNPDGDRVAVFEMEPNLTWIDPEPKSGAVEPDGRQAFTVGFTAEELPEGEYNVELELLHNAEGDRYVIPVHFVVDHEWTLGEKAPVVAGYQFLAPYPNPFNPAVNLNFTLTKPAVVRLEIRDITGRLVSELDLGELSAGSHQTVWDGSGIPNGIYFARLTAGSYSATRKLALVK